MKKYFINRKIADEIETRFIGSDEVVMKLGLGMTLYFPRPFCKVRHLLLPFWNKYLDFIGRNTLTWMRLGGGNRSHTISNASYKKVQQWLSGAKEYGSVCWISAHSGSFDCMGDFGFMLTGYEEAKDEFDEESCFLDMTLPLRLLETHSPEELSNFLVELADMIPFYAGVAGFVFQHSPYKFTSLLPTMRDLSQQYRGVEIMASERLCYLAERGVPTINWLTFIGQDHVKQAGGVALMSAKLPAEAKLIHLNHGAAIMAGTAPTLGDKLQDSDPNFNTLREVYRVLKPIQFTDPVYAFNDMVMDGEQTVDWLTRLERN